MATVRFAEALQWSFLAPIPHVVGAAAAVAWSATFVGLLRSLRRP